MLNLLVMATVMMIIMAISCDDEDVDNDDDDSYCIYLVLGTLLEL
jgi:hypothetical protein